MFCYYNKICYNDKDNKRGENIICRKHVKSLDFYGKTITVETGELAKQANGSVLIRYDDTVILSTAVAGKEPKDVDFFSFDSYI